MVYRKIWATKVDLAEKSQLILLPLIHLFMLTSLAIKQIKFSQELYPPRFLLPPYRLVPPRPVYKDMKENIKSREQL